MAMITRTSRVLYWISTVLLLLPMLGSAIYYMVDQAGAIAAFEGLRYPGDVMYFNATAKFLGAIAILAPVPRFLKEWAYAGYLFILLLATQAVWMAMPGVPWMMFVFIGIWAFAYWSYTVVTPSWGAKPR